MSTSRYARCEPMNPAPPVTSTLIALTHGLMGQRLSCEMLMLRVSREQVYIGFDPIAQKPDPGFLFDIGRPSHANTSLFDITDIAGLVARPPVFEVDRNLFAGQLPQQISKFRPYRKRVGRTTPNVEDLASHSIDIADRQAQSSNEIIDEKDVPHLLSVAVYRNRLARECRDNEMSHPPLILRAELPRAVNAAHPEHDGW